MEINSAEKSDFFCKALRKVIFPICYFNFTFSWKSEYSYILFFISERDCILPLQNTFFKLPLQVLISISLIKELRSWLWTVCGMAATAVAVDGSSQHCKPLFATLSNIRTLVEPTSTLYEIWIHAVYRNCFYNHLWKLNEYHKMMWNYLYS